MCVGGGATPNFFLPIFEYTLTCCRHDGESFRGRKVHEGASILPWGAETQAVTILLPKTGHRDSSAGFGAMNLKFWVNVR